MALFYDYLLSLGWIFAIVIIMSVAIPIFVHVFDKLSGKLDVWKELKRKNAAVAIVVGSALIALALVIGMIV